MGFFDFLRRKKRDDKINLEEAVKRDFDLTLDTNALMINLGNLRTRSIIQYNIDEIFCLVNSLRKKADIVRSAYPHGKFRFVAEEFVQTAIDLANKYNSQKREKIKKGEASDSYVLNLEYSRAA